MDRYFCRHLIRRNQKTLSRRSHQARHQWRCLLTRLDNDWLVFVIRRYSGQTTLSWAHFRKTSISVLGLAIKMHTMINLKGKTPARNGVAKNNAYPYFHGKNAWCQRNGSYRLGAWLLVCHGSRLSWLRAFVSHSSMPGVVCHTTGWSWEIALPRPPGSLSHAVKRTLYTSVCIPKKLTKAKAFYVIKKCGWRERMRSRIILNSWDASNSSMAKPAIDLCFWPTTWLWARKPSRKFIKTDGTLNCSLSGSNNTCASNDFSVAVTTPCDHKFGLRCAFTSWCWWWKSGWGWTTPPTKSYKY